MPATTSSRTVVYDRWYLAEIEERDRRAARKRMPAQSPRPVRVLDRREADPRRVLALATEKRGQSLAALSRMIDRPSRYLDRFVREGQPVALPANEHAMLAAFFGVDERGLGVRLLWSPL